MTYTKYSGAADHGLYGAILFSCFRSVNVKPTLSYFVNTHPVTSEVVGTELRQWFSTQQIPEDIKRA